MPEVFAYGTLFGSDENPTSTTDPIFNHVPFTRATTIEVAIPQIRYYLAARDHGKINSSTNIYIHLVVPYLTKEQGRSYPDQDILLKFWMDKLAQVYHAIGPSAAGIDGIVIDELLVPVPWNDGIEKGAADLIRLFNERLKSEASGHYADLGVCAWFLNPDTMHLEGAAGRRFLIELFTHCRYVLAEMHQLETPANLLSSADYIRTVVRHWADLGVNAALIRSKAIVSLPLPFFQLAKLDGKYNDPAAEKAYLLDLIKWYGKPDADTSDAIPSIRELTAGVAIYLENYFKSHDLIAINKAIGEWPHG
jgi:hypothetical protein